MFRNKLPYYVHSMPPIKAHCVIADSFLCLAFRKPTEMRHNISYFNTSWSEIPGRIPLTSWRLFHTRLPERLFRLLRAAMKLLISLYQDTDWFTGNVSWFNTINWSLTKIDTQKAKTIGYLEFRCCGEGSTFHGLLQKRLSRWTKESIS